MTPDFVFTHRDWLIGLAIILLAFALRLVIIVDRAHHPLDGAFDPLPEFTDQQTYYEHVQQFRDGTFPPKRFFYQPGMSYFLIAASKLLRTDSLGVLRVFTAALASINCGLFMASVRLAFGRRGVSILGGLLLAIYPVGAFYDTDFVITAQATLLLSLALFGVLWLWRFPRNWIGVVLYGASFGALAVTRFEPIVLAPVFGLWLLWVRRDRNAVLQVALAAAICALVMLPVILHNRAGGANYLITPVGAAEIYRGNNRDTNGDYGGGAASATTRSDYWHYLWNDIRLEPLRFIELEVHKIGLYLSPNEPGNNLNYVLSGENVSPTLRAIPLDFRILLILFLFGLIALIRGKEPTAALFGFAFLILMGAILLIWVEARLRTPTILLMIPPAAYGIVYIAEHFPLRRIDGLWHFQVQHAGLYVLPLIVISATVVLADLAERHLPRPLTVGDLPESAQRVGAIYDGTLEFVGWEVQEEYSRAGTIEPFFPYVVTLYWRLLEPTDTDYGYSLVYIVDGERVFGSNHWAGTVSAPKQTTADWKPGTIYVEHVGLTYKRYDGPNLTSGHLLLSVFINPDAVPLLPADNLPDRPFNIELSQPTLIWGDGLLPDTITRIDAPVPFGDVLRLLGWTFPTTAAPGETVEVTLGWQTTGEPITRCYVLAVYVFDAAGQFTEHQADSPPHNGQLLTSSLPTHFLFGDTKQLTLPDQPGTYTLYAGVYDYDTRDRLPVPDGNLFRLGEIEVKAN
jgi:4-amino-4-deoxy-L-arabinose transferase-like glycosyltransferase